MSRPNYYWPGLRAPAPKNFKKMSDRQSQLNPFWKTFPQPLRSALQSIPQNSGRLDAWHCSAAMKAAGMSLEDLMVKLLPAARLYARVPISNFKVGTVARARFSENSDESSLFLGANIEFAGQSLSQTIHAEQTAIVNAWQQGAVQIDAIAVSAAPCGRCRQFFYELDTRLSLTVMIQHGCFGGRRHLPGGPGGKANDRQPEGCLQAAAGFTGT